MVGKEGVSSVWANSKVCARRLLPATNAAGLQNNQKSGRIWFVAQVVAPEVRREGALPSNLTVQIARLLLDNAATANDISVRVRNTPVHGRRTDVLIAEIDDIHLRRSVLCLRHV